MWRVWTWLEVISILYIDSWKTSRQRIFLPETFQSNDIHSCFSFLSPLFLSCLSFFFLYPRSCWTITLLHLCCPLFWLLLFVHDFLSLLYKWVCTTWGKWMTQASLWWIKMHGRTVTRSYTEYLTLLEACSALVKPINKPLRIPVCFHLPPHHSLFPSTKERR